MQKISCRNMWFSLRTGKPDAKRLELFFFTIYAFALFKFYFFIICIFYNKIHYKKMSNFKYF